MNGTENPADRPDGGYKAVLAAIYQYEGEMLLSERRFADAITESQHALTIAGTQYPDVAIRAKRVKGLAQSLSGGKRDGKILCDEAVELATKTKDPRLISSSLLALAEALLVNGDASTALTTALRAQVSFAHSGQMDSEWRAWLIAARATRLTGNDSKQHEYSSRAAELLAGLEQKLGLEAYDGFLTRPDVQYLRGQLDKSLPKVNSPIQKPEEH